jgi:hypothetical protein
MEDDRGNRLPRCLIRRTDDDRSFDPLLTELVFISRRCEGRTPIGERGAYRVVTYQCSRQSKEGEVLCGRHLAGARRTEAAAAEEVRKINDGTYARIAQLAAADKKRSER